ncbi:MAG: hypothetical protein K0S20_381, partial [Patescibacteria group bacterium]|nr:hypothetical protein [Patescibacteria group bacterium]
FHIISKDCSLKLNKSIRNLLLESADTLFGPSGCLPRGSHSYRCDGDWNCNITGSCPLNQNLSERGLRHLTISLSIHPRHAQIRDEIAVRLLKILDDLKWKEKEPAEEAKKYVYREN